MKKNVSCIVVVVVVAASMTVVFSSRDLAAPITPPAVSAPTPAPVSTSD